MRLLDLLLAAAILAGLAVIAALTQPGETLAGPARAVDGDTLDLAGERVRLAGIDAPELAQDCTRDGRRHACGREARQALAAVLDRGAAHCALRGRDAYGRHLARCTVAGRDIGEHLVSGGLALAYGAGTYRAAEAEARAARRGLWAGAFEPPAQWRAQHPRG